MLESLEPKIHLLNQRSYWLLTDEDNQVISISSGFASVYLDSENDTAAIAIFLRESASERLLLWESHHNYDWWQCLKEWPASWPQLSIWVNPINSSEFYRQHLIPQFLKEVLGRRPSGKIVTALKKADYMPRIRSALQKEQLDLRYCTQSQKLLENS